jgi:FemAB-related protein (PEP-CTERM system-associated)
VITVHQYDRHTLPRHLLRLEAYLIDRPLAPLSWNPAWLEILHQELGHVPYCLEAVEGNTPRGFLALAFVRSLLFGRFLVSLPYLNYGGVFADNDETARMLIDRAVKLADELRVRHLELRHEKPIEHPNLPARLTSKVQLRRSLPASTELLWKQLDGKVRNQVRKGQKNNLPVAWGGVELLDDFYDVFSRNMRDLGTPVYGRGLFRSILEQFPARAELCVVRGEGRVLAGALLLHGRGVTEVPSASSLRKYNATCANMLLYWSLLERAVQRGQSVFDFGRSTEGSGTYDFKLQWGAEPHPAVWQYYLRSGSVDDVRRESTGYRPLIRIWQRLPVSLTRLIGPAIVRGIP